LNERIKELAEQAGIHFNTVGFLDGDPNGSARMVGYSKMEKFAELIVSKCIELMDESYRGDMYTGDVFASEYNNCINEQVETLQDYFGVNK